jgi:chemotaxis protein methyltransferase CheR
MALFEGIDLISCRNVLIYLDGESRKRVARHFYNSLLPDSYLFLDHSESLFGTGDDFRLVHLPGTTAYLKTGQRSAGAR